MIGEDGMSEENKHTALIPSAQIAEEAGKRTEIKKVRKGEPPLHMTDDMRRLSTPWSISIVRAKQIDSSDLPAGVVLDAAAGSGAQLIALATELKSDTTPLTEKCGKKKESKARELKLLRRN